MKTKIFGLAFGLIVLGGAGLLSAENRFTTGVDAEGASEWRDSLTVDADPQIGSPVDSVVGGNGATTSLSPATMQTISAEMPQGGGEYEVTFRDRTVNTGGHGRRTVSSQSCDKWGACSTVFYKQYRRCTRTIVYEDAYVNGTKVGSETKSTSYNVTTSWSASTTYATGSNFSQCN